MSNPTKRSATTVQIFSVPITIDYQDTDATGVVYHGRYLAFLERARNACLRQIGFAPSKLSQQTGMVFALVRAELDFLRPAQLDDVLNVGIDQVRVVGARLEFIQSVQRGTTRLLEARLIVTMLDSNTFRPCRIPAVLKDAISQWLKQTKTVDENDSQ